MTVDIGSVLLCIDSGQLELRVADGFGGYPPSAPFDCIHVGAAPEKVPDALRQQLAPGPRRRADPAVGPAGGDQRFCRVTRSADGATFTEQELFGVRYVPLTTPEKQLRGRR